MKRYLKALCALLALGAGMAWGQDYPSKPILRVVPFAPGGSSDFLSRLIGQKVTNLPGGSAQATVTGAMPVEFARFIDAERQRWGAFMKRTAIKPERTLSLTLS